MQGTNARHLIDPRAGTAATMAALIFAVGILFGTVIDGTVPAVEPQIIVPAADRSYDAVEDTRANRGLSVPAADRSYDAVQDTRANRGLD